MAPLRICITSRLSVRSTQNALSSAMETIAQSASNNVESTVEKALVMLWVRWSRRRSGSSDRQDCGGNDESV